MNCRRTSLSTDIALPDIGVLETNVTTAEEAEEDDEHAEVVEEFWDDFL